MWPQNPRAAKNSDFVQVLRFSTLSFVTQTDLTSSYYEFFATMLYKHACYTIGVCTQGTDYLKWVMVASESYTSNNRSDSSSEEAIGSSCKTSVAGTADTSTSQSFLLGTKNLWYACTDFLGYMITVNLGFLVVWIGLFLVLTLVALQYIQLRQLASYIHVLYCIFTLYSLGAGTFEVTFLSLAPYNRQNMTCQMKVCSHVILNTQFILPTGPCLSWCGWKSNHLLHIQWKWCSGNHFQRQCVLLQ